MNQDEWHRMTLRIPPDMHLRLKKVAESSGRPLTTEILKRLSDTLAMENLNSDELNLSIIEGAEKIAAIAKQISVIADGCQPAKIDVLDETEKNLLRSFKKAKPDEKALILSLLKKLS